MAVGQGLTGGVRGHYAGIAVGPDFKGSASYVLKILIFAPKLKCLMTIAYCLYTLSSADR